ncbi:reverse transcriptase domain-containing protein [Tanacetum coccineum]
MDDPNMTMEEYIKIEEEKARRRGRVFNWKTATYGKIRVDDDPHDLRSVESEFPAIVIDDAFAPQDALPYKSQVSTSVNDEIDFRISFDESDDEDYEIICDKNSFSYKMISVKNLKMDSENDNEKAGIPSFPPPKPTTSYVDDLDFFKDFENEFLAIVYNNVQMSKSDYLTEQSLSPKHNSESDLNDETSLSEYDEVGQNILYFNVLFPFNVIHPDDLKSDEENDNNEIDIIQFLGGNLNTHRSNMLMETNCDKIEKHFDEESFVLELNVNIVTWICLFNGMLLCFIIYSYVPFCILFDPKRYYKDGDCAIMLRRPREPPYLFDYPTRRLTREEILAKFIDEGPTSGHHSANIIAKKVYESGFYWPIFFKDANEYVRRCDACQRSGNLSSRTKCIKIPFRTNGSSTSATQQDQQQPDP